MRPFNSCVLAALFAAGAAASSHAQSLVGSWLLGNSTTSDSVLVTFLDENTYYLAHDGVADGAGTPGMEHGAYSWNPVNGAFSASIPDGTGTDTTGDWGLSSLGGGATLFLSGNTLTLTPSGEDAVALLRAPSVTGTLLGSWLYTDGDGAAVVTFLDNYIYFMAEDGTADGTGGPGMERGTYSFVGGTLSVNTLTDTSGEWGLSESGPLALSISGDSFSFVEEGETFTLTRVGASAIPEPSTYVLIVSATALGAAIWRRRKAARARRA